MEIISQNQDNNNVIDLFFAEAERRFLFHEQREQEKIDYYKEKGIDPNITNPYKDEYLAQRPGCRKHIEIYNYHDNTFTMVGCHNWRCRACRGHMKRVLFEELLPTVLNNAILGHIVITAEGKKYRETHSIEQSYKDVLKAWNKVRKIIDYTYNKDKEDQFMYIVFSRAQRSGYCHLHILTNFNINVEWLKCVVKKYSELGFIHITKNKNATKYIIDDFYKDHEFYIPKRKRRYSSSRNLKFTKNITTTENKIVIKKNRVGEDTRFKAQREARIYANVIKQVEQITQSTAPNELYDKQYGELVTRKIIEMETQ